MAPTKPSRPERLLGLLGLGLRAGRVVMGVDRVRLGLQRGEFACLVLASDASPRAVEKLVRLAKARGVPMLEGPRAEEIGRRLARPAVMAVGVSDRALARGLANAGSAGPTMEA